MKIKKYESIVLDILEHNKYARKSDFILYGSVLKKLGVDLTTTTLYEYLATADRKEMPSFETITRCRRHIQALRTDLQDNQTAVARQDAEIDYKLYNLSGIGENK